MNSEPPGKLRDRHANGSLLDEIVYFFGLQTRLPLPCRPAAFRSIAVTLSGIFGRRSTLTIFSDGAAVGGVATILVRFEQGPDLPRTVRHLGASRGLTEV